MNLLNRQQPHSGSLCGRVASRYSSLNTNYSTLNTMMRTRNLLLACGLAIILIGVSAAVTFSLAQSNDEQNEVYEGTDREYLYFDSIDHFKQLGVNVMLFNPVFESPDQCPANLCGLPDAAHPARKPLEKAHWRL